MTSCRPQRRSECAVLIAAYDRRVTISGNTPRPLVEWSSVNRLTGPGRRNAIALAGLIALGEQTFQVQISERTPALRRVDEWGPGS
jgi:hypothetical protein